MCKSGVANRLLEDETKRRALDWAGSDVGFYELIDCQLLKKEWISWFSSDRAPRSDRVAVGLVKRTNQWSITRLVEWRAKADASSASLIGKWKQIGRVAFNRPNKSVLRLVWSFADESVCRCDALGFIIRPFVRAFHFKVHDLLKRTRIVALFPNLLRRCCDTRLSSRKKEITLDNYLSTADITELN